MNRLAEQLAKAEQEGYDEAMGLWGPGQIGTQRSTLAESPKYQDLLVILHNNPILVGPALAWLQQKVAELSRATLDVLYTPEEIEEMQASLTGRAKASD